MGNWSDIPMDLIECVEKYLDFADKVRIRVVCTSWNSYLHNVPKLVSEELPWLLLEDDTAGASLYTIHEAKLYPLNLPELKHKIFKGSSCGWIVTLEDESSSCIDDIYAFNPLTRVQIKLPPRSAFPDIKDFNPRRTGEEYIMKERHEQHEYSKPRPEPEPEPDTESDTDTDTDSEPDTDSYSYSYSEPDTDSEPEPDTDSEPEPDTDSEPEPEPHTGSESEPETEPEYDPLTCKSRTNQILIGKVVLSSSPASNDCMVVAIYGEFLQLAWCRPHHKEWTSIRKYCGKGGPHNTGVEDVIFHNGQLHALYGNGRLEIYESIDPQVIVRQVVAPYEAKPRPIVLATPMYLAACPNLGIILATRYYERHRVDGVLVRHTRCVYIHKVVESSQTRVEVEGLGENILFLGLNMSSSIPVSDELKVLGYKKNCIYFTDHFAFIFGRDNQDDSDMGLLDIDDSFTEALPGFKLEPEYFWPPPIWVTPSAT